MRFALALQGESQLRQFQVVYGGLVADVSVASALLQIGVVSGQKVSECRPATCVLQSGRRSLQSVLAFCSAADFHSSLARARRTAAM